MNKLKIFKIGIFTVMSALFLALTLALSGSGKVFAYSGQYNVDYRVTESFNNGSFDESFNYDAMNFINQNLEHLVAVEANDLNREVFWDGPNINQITSVYNWLTIPNAFASLGGSANHDLILDDEGNWHLSNHNSTTNGDPGQLDITFYFNIPGLDNKRPAFSGQENFVTSVDDPKSVAYFQSFLTAIDETDGDITDSIYIINDNYTTNRFVLGRYAVTFGVKDAAGNEAVLETFVNVVDITNPNITGNTSKATISYTGTWNINTFKSTLVASDNYDTLTNADITIKSDGYTSNKTQLGTYNVVFEVTDSSGNKGTFTKQVEVIDDIAPTWSGPSNITKPTNQALTISDIIAQLTATDAKEGNVSASIKVIEDNYSGNGHITGVYTIVFEAQDSKGNKSTHTVTITANDKIAPIWYIQDGVSIVLAQGVQLTHQQIIDILAASGQIQHQATTTYTFPVDNYSGNETEPGVYTMQLHARSTNGNEYVHEFAITVMEGDDDGITIGEAGNWIANNIIWILLGIGGASLVIYLLSNNNKTTKKRRK